MRNPRQMLFAVAVVLVIPCAVGQAGDSEVRVEKVAPGTFAVVQPTARRFNESNSLFVIRDGSVLVVDTQSSLEATGEVIREIRARTKLPVSQLVLTHWHGDHVQGISAYKEHWPEVEVIGHVSVAEDILGRAQPQAFTGIGEQVFAHLVSDLGPVVVFPVQCFLVHIAKYRCHLPISIDFPLFKLIGGTGAASNEFLRHVRDQLHSRAMRA